MSEHYIGRASKYYIGDLCHVLGGSWSEVCDLMTGNGGEYTLANGTPFATYKTRYGDGLFPLIGPEANSRFDFHGETQPRAWLSVDSGTIGCVHIEACDPTNIEFGYVWDAKQFFMTGHNPNTGTMFFGDLRVETDNLSEEWEWDDEEDDE